MFFSTMVTGCVILDVLPLDLDGKNIFQNNVKAKKCYYCNT